MHLQVLAIGSNSYLGRVNPPAPDGCKQFYASLLNDARQLSVIQFDCGATKVVWLQKLVSRGPDEIRWRLIDVLTTPILKEGYDLHSSVDGCIYADARYSEVFVIGRWVWAPKVQHYNGHVADITQAWIPDAKSKRIEEIPAHKVSCAVDEIRE